MNSSFVVRGNLCHSKDVKTLESMEKGYVVCEKGVCAGMFLDLPEAYQGLPLLDFGQSLVIPGLVDLHVHAPQYAFRGLGMDMELLDWLNARVFPEEARYRDLEYAKRAYSFFVEDLKKSSTTRACIFATLHSPATILLMDMLEASGLVTLVGKVNMDRNGPSVLQEESAAFSAGQTLAWLEQIDGRYSNTAPIITPRFIPSCSDELMTALSEIR
ncbi:amidohydrolase family protein, partial [Desulfovibrio sp. OttesenSCG-928-M14]|nr:amidohydrolase family protein [Desulfovibrio sp. OttesenSCG-928-M14]